MADIAFQEGQQSRGNILKVGAGQILIGIWLVAAPFVLGYYSQPRATLNSVLVGFLALALGIASSVDLSRFRILTWLESYVGFWLFAAPFVLGYLSPAFPYDGAVPLWNDLICGGLLWFLSYIKGIAEPWRTRSRAAAIK